MEKRELAGGFYGGHYDSVKQAAWRDKTLETVISREVRLDKEKRANEILVDMYTTRLRLDILLSGKISLSDAQYYDGTFFHSINQTKFFPAFEVLPAELRLFEVWRRPLGLLGIINKPFIFSALSSNATKIEVSNTIKQVLSGKTFTSPKEAFDCYVAAMDESIKPEFNAIAENMFLLDSAPPWVFKQWKTDAERSSLRPKAINEMGFKIPFGEFEDADPILFAMSIDLGIDPAKLGLVEAQIAALKLRAKDLGVDDTHFGRWNRSRIWEMVKNYLERADIKAESSADDPVKQGWAWYLKVYNRFLALSQDCESQDLGENLIYGQTNTKADDDYRREIKKQISQDILYGIPLPLDETIAKESWDDFWNRLLKEPLYSRWTKWMQVRREQSHNPNLIDKNYHLFSALDPLVALLRQDYGRTVKYDKGLILTAAGTIAPALDLIAGGALTEVMGAAGLLFESIPLLIGAGTLVKEAVGNPLEYLNMIKFGLASTSTR